MKSDPDDVGDDEPIRRFPGEAAVHDSAAH
jgi:hypothetical protein